MRRDSERSWQEENRAYLVACLEPVRRALERYAASRGGAGSESRDETERAPEPTPWEASALETLVDVFSLSAFERDLVLLCAGVELDGRFPDLCARAHGDPRNAYPTLSLALAALTEPHWSALRPTGPLRRWRLVQLGPGMALTARPLALDERILHYLAGVPCLDERLAALLEPGGAAAELSPSHAALAERMRELWREPEGASAGTVISLVGGEHTARRQVAATACAEVGIRLHVLRSACIPDPPEDRERLIRLWEREAALSEAALLIEWDERGARPAAAFVERVQGLVIASAREPLEEVQRPVIRLELRPTRPPERHELWRSVLGLGSSEADGTFESLAMQFNPSVAEVSALAASLTEAEKKGDRAQLGSKLWELCRGHSRPRLDGLVERIEPAAGWDDLVLPEAQRGLLHQMVAHVRHRFRVYETWGFVTKGKRGLGLSALFCGASGTGKTMAAEVLANELQLDLFRIDLSSVVSRYIGETEKNLARIFEAAEAGGAILLFDEAEALFGKRSEVKDAHDRFANIQVSYLLQRMEAYRGLAILTTNMKVEMDSAFMRRLRFIVEFPFPDAEQRAAIWRRVFPVATPTEDIDVARLSGLSVAGGNIRNMALHAAFLAVDAGSAVRMSHVFEAARYEYEKLEKPLTEVEAGGFKP